MLHHSEFEYRPEDFEREKASNGYLMSLVALIAGLPMPIANLIATGIFYGGNRKGTFYVRWHCMQALLSQITVFVVNAVAVGWTIYIFFGKGELSNVYIGYLLTALLFNLFEFLLTIYTAVQTRKGRHIEWWFWGPLTNMICRS